MSIISVSHLSKHFQVHKKEPGLSGSVRSLFLRKYETVRAINDISFDINEGDDLILEEYDLKTKKYTGRKIKKKAWNIIKVNPTQMNDIDDIKKFGFYIIEIK